MTPTSFSALSRVETPKGFDDNVSLLRNPPLFPFLHTRPPNRLKPSGISTVHSLQCNSTIGWYLSWFGYYKACYWLAQGRNICGISDIRNPSLGLQTFLFTMLWVVCLLYGCKYVCLINLFLRNSSSNIKYNFMVEDNFFLRNTAC